MLSYACSWFSIVLLQYNVFLFCTTNSYQQSRWLQISSLYVYIRWPSSVQNKIKIVFAAYISKAQNTTCTIWLLCCKYFVHFSDRRLSAFDVEKTELRSVIKRTILTDSFVPLHALLFWLIIEVVNARFILNNELWSEFLLGHVGIIWEVLQKLVDSLVLAFSTPIWQTLCSYAKMHKIFITQKSYCACRVLSLGTIRSK